MAYIIITLVLLVIIVPILSVLPSARQKEQMVMRQVARNAGVQVELTSITDPNPKQDKYISHIGKQLDPILKVVAWRVQRKREGGWRQLPAVDWCLQKNLDGTWAREHWPADTMSEELVEYLNETIEQLPDDVEQVEENTYNLTVYWHERTKGSEQQVIDFLKNCVALPLHRPVDGEADD